MCLQRQMRFYRPIDSIIWRWSPRAPEGLFRACAGCSLPVHVITRRWRVRSIPCWFLESNRRRSSFPRGVLRRFRSRASKCRRVGSICTGAYILAQAGLLDGKRAATHWAFVNEFSSRFPKVAIDGNPIWIRDGNIYSSAGVTSGIDLSLALVEEDHGQKVALEVARILVVFLCRPGNQAQFRVSLREQRTDNRPLRDLQVWIVENLQSDLSTPALAARVAISDRNFQRVFTREIGRPPALYVEEVRLEAVRRKLESSNRGLEEIASACGFNSADVMSRSFQRHLKTTPAEYRARFCTSGAQPLPKQRKPLNKP
jgi:transcriptional regulator GlxA family with amidase domain